MKPSIPKGTRDFSPVEMVQRNYIFETIRNVFQLYGYAPIETPAMEKLPTLMGKYGDEGDKLLFKVLDTGPVLEELKASNTEISYSNITGKGLRYDLTVPFARYVVQHQNEITFPFKRYQMQPVWRADKPQKGRYREFYQCDADVIGSTSLLNEVELVQMIDAVFTYLDVAVTIKINNRKILSGIAEVIGEKDKIVDITVAIDKLDKIGLDAVNQELHDRGVANSAIAKLQPLINFKGDFEQKRSILKHFLSSSEIGKKGIEEIEYIFNRINSPFEGGKGDVSPFNKSKLELDITLARGLNYYTGAIFEIQTDEGSLRSSICGGGRYDDLTGIFGLPNVSGVGISFGIDRIFDVLTECKKFDKIDYTKSTTKLLFAHFGEQEQLYCLPLLKQVRAAGINAEVYPDITKKIVKQFEYADKKKIPFVVVVGGDEMKTGELTLKNMITGEQKKTTITKLVEQLQIN